MRHIDHDNLRQAALDEAEIIEAGLLDQYRADLDHELRRRKPLPDLYRRMGNW